MKCLLKTLTQHCLVRFRNSKAPPRYAALSYAHVLKKKHEIGKYKNDITYNTSFKKSRT